MVWKGWTILVVDDDTYYNDLDSLLKMSTGGQKLGSRNAATYGTLLIAIWLEIYINGNKCIEKLTGYLAEDHGLKGRKRFWYGHALSSLTQYWFETMEAQVLVTGQCREPKKLWVFQSIYLGTRIYHIRRRAWPGFSKLYCLIQLSTILKIGQNFC